jgi:hypothetical protein
MIVDSKEFVRSGLKDFLSDITSDNIEERYRSLSYYEGMQGEMETDLGRYFPLKSLDVPLIVQNITSKLVNARAIGYKDPPARTNEKYLENVKDLDQSMLTAERLTYLLGSHLIRSRFSEESNMIEYDQIIEFEPIFEARAREPFAYIYPIYNHGQARNNEVVYAYWSDEEHFLVHQNGRIESVNEGNVNPYGVLPFTVCHRHPYTTDFIRNGANDIINANLMINLLMTELGLAMRLQALGQPVISGIDNASKVVLGVDKPMILPEGASFQFVSPGGDINSYINAVRFYVDSVAYNNNLKVKWSVGREAFISGESLKMAEIDLTEAVMSDYQMTWRGVENKRFETDRAILDAHNIKVTDEYSVDFSEPRFPLTAKEEREQWAWEWDNNLSTTKDWFRKYNPDLTEEELDEKVEKIVPEKPEETTAESFLAEALSS